MEVLISRFVDDPNMDLRPFADASMQIAFFQRKVFNKIDHPAFKKRLDEFDIRVKSVHAPATDVYHRKGDEFITTIKTIRDVYGVDIITIHPQRGGKEEAKAHFRELEEAIRELGVVLAYETFEKEMMNRKWVSQVEEMHRYFDALAYPFLGITYDFTHSTYEENVEEVAQYNEKIYVIHLSDALRDRPLDPNEYHQHLPLGYGDYRVLDFLDLLIHIRYRHFIVIEYHNEFDHLLKTDAAAVSSYMQGRSEELTDLLARRRDDKREADT